MRNETFGARIEALRSLAGMSARELDALAGLRAGHTRLIETGERADIAARTVSSIAGVFGVSIDWLYSGDGSRGTDEEIMATVLSHRSTRAAG